MIGADFGFPPSKSVFESDLWFNLVIAGRFVWPGDLFSPLFATSRLGNSDFGGFQEAKSVEVVAQIP